MAKRMVKVRECDRCPRNRKPNPATMTIPFSFGDMHWLIDLCVECHMKMDREMHAWGRLGREDESKEQIRRFTKETTDAGRRLAELRARQAEAAPPKVLTKRHMHLSGPIPEGLPEDAKDWVFDPHAMDRMRERKVSAVEALYAACKPEVHVASEHEHGDRVVHRARGVKVVVDPDQKIIYTVAREDVEDDRAITPTPTRKAI